MLDERLTVFFFSSFVDIIDGREPRQAQRLYYSFSMQVPVFLAFFKLCCADSARRRDEEASIRELNNWLPRITVAASWI